MGLFRWIKKELEFPNFHKRRESAPPFMTGNFDPDITRDEAYLKALNKFNEWRTNQRLEKMNSPAHKPNNKNDDINNINLVELDEISSKEISIRGDTPAGRIDSNEDNKFYHRVDPSDIYDPNVIVHYDGTGSTNQNKTSTKKKKLRKIKRYSPPYQSVVNKHGDVVEYALPYAEQNLIIKEGGTSDEKPTTSSSASRSTTPSSESFIEPMNLYLQNHSKNDLLITDLDKSHIEEKRDIFKELDSLERWSESIPQTNPMNISDNLDQSIPTGIIISTATDIWCRTGILQSNFLNPLEYSTGIFRNTNVCYRSITNRNKRKLYLSKVALNRDFEMLNLIKHSDIVLLMALCYEDSLDLNRMTLILEPFDFTLSYLLHDVEQKFSLSQSIKIVNQITSAVIYLEECGYIHTNISSHCILIRKNPTFFAKLSSFELTTEINNYKTKNEIESLYKKTLNFESEYVQPDELSKLSEYVLLLRNNQKKVKEKYRDISKNINKRENWSYDDQSDFITFKKIDKKHLPYYLNFRKQFSYHNYQAPEILKSNEKFIYPTKSCDVYSLTLLLWELLNNLVPFAVFNCYELEKLYITQKSNGFNNFLPNFEHNRCYYFEKILKYGLQISPSKRIMNVKHFALLLNNIKNDFVGLGIYNENHDYVKIVAEPRNSMPEYNNILTKDPQKRLENVITVEKTPITYSIDTDSGIINKTFLKHENSKLNEISNIASYHNHEPTSSSNKQHRTISRTNGEISNIVNIKNTDSNNTGNLTKDHNDNISHVSSFDQFLKSRPNIIYERTSTLKKKIKKNEDGQPVASRKSVKELFKLNDDKKVKNVDRLENELEQIADDVKYSKEDIMSEFYKNKEQIDNHNFKIEHNDNKKFEQNEINDLKSNHNKNENLVTKINVAPKTPISNAHLIKNINRSNINSCPSSYRFKVGEISLPDTPIARKNKIRRYAWLSDSHQNISSPAKTPNNNTKMNITNIEGLSESVKPESTLKKNVNVNIKISNRKQNNFESKYSSNTSNSCSNFSADISKCLSEKLRDLLPDFTEKILKELEEYRLKAETDENKINFEDSLQEKFIEKNILDSSFKVNGNNRESNEIKLNLTSGDDLKENFYKTDKFNKLNKSAPHVIENSNQNDSLIMSEIVKEAMRRKKNRRSIEITKNEANILEDDTPSRISVHEAVMKIENMTKQLTNLVVDTNKNSTKPNDDCEVKKSATLNSKVANEKKIAVFHPTVTQVIPKTFLNNPTTITIQNNEHTLIKRSIYRESIITDNVKSKTSSGGTTTANLTPKNRKKLTTRVTVNFRKTSRRLSDIGLMDSMQQRKVLTTLKPRHSVCGEEILRLVDKKKSEGEIPKLEELQNLFCCNCHSKISLEQLKSVLDSRNSLHECGSNRSSIDFSNIIRFDGKSTEDLYIDDDFCQGLCLGANMELIENPDDDLLDSIDFDILSEYQPNNSQDV